MPRLFWHTNPEDPESHPVDTTFEATPSNDATQNALVIKTLSRDFYRKSFWCLADNNNVTQPASTDVTIDMKRESSFVMIHLVVKLNETESRCSLPRGRVAQVYNI